MKKSIFVMLSLLGIAISAKAADAPAKPGINDSFKDPNLQVNSWVERFEREGREVYDHREEIVKLAEIPTGSVVADIGAGTGMFVPLLLNATGAQGKVIAVDIVPKFLAHIRGEAQERGQSKQIETVLCTAESTRLPEASIDFAFICDTYHHFEHPEKTMTSLHRALRPGGMVYLIDFKRVEGESSDWILSHVRASESTVIQEVESAGFEKVGKVDLLKDNYILHFRKKS